MTFEEFERTAWQEWERIPEQYRAGVDGLRIERGALPHDSQPDVFTLGECVTESYPSDFGGPDTIRSVVVLHYGSFFRLSRDDEEFDWEVELWETLTHELQHHLESLAQDDALVDMDYAADENHKRYEGEPFDPFFFRQGLDTGDGWRRVEDEFFLEAPRPADGRVWFEWHGSAYTAAAASTSADVQILTVTDGVPDPPGALHIVIVNHRNWFRALLAVLRGIAVVEQDVTAVPD